MKRTTMQKETGMRTDEDLIHDLSIGFRAATDGLEYTGAVPTPRTGTIPWKAVPLVGAAVALTAIGHVGGADRTGDGNPRAGASTSQLRLVDLLSSGYTSQDPSSSAAEPDLCSPPAWPGMETAQPTDPDVAKELERTQAEMNGALPPCPQGQSPYPFYSATVPGLPDNAVVSEELTEAIRSADARIGGDHAVTAYVGTDPKAGWAAVWVEGFVPAEDQEFGRYQETINEHLSQSQLVQFLIDVYTQPEATSPVN
jgi:hypothetical protein